MLLGFGNRGYRDLASLAVAQATERPHFTCVRSTRLRLPTDTPSPSEGVEPTLAWLGPRKTPGTATRLPISVAPASWPRDAQSSIPRLAW